MPTGAPPQEAVQEGPWTMRQPDAQAQVPRSRRAQGLLLVAIPEDSGLLVLVPGTLQDLGAEKYLHLDLTSLEIFSGLVEHATHSMQARGKALMSSSS